MPVDVVILCIGTVRSLSSSFENGNVTEFGMNFEASYPPMVKLPSTLLSPLDCQLLANGMEKAKTAYYTDSQQYTPSSNLEFSLPSSDSRCNSVLGSSRL